MADQPPPSYEAAAGNPRLLNALVVHLQVWHYSREGRSPENNEKFAALFRNPGLPEWAVFSPQLEGTTDQSAHDHYVPVEVRFCHQFREYSDESERAMADVRKLFFRVAPQFIYQLFVHLGSTPHNLNMFPVGVPDEYVSRYTHSYVLNRLGLRINGFFVPRPMTTNRVQSCLRDAVHATLDVLETLAEIVGIYLVYRHTQPGGIENGVVNNLNWAQAAGALSSEELRTALRRLFAQIMESTGPDPQDAFQRAEQTANVRVALNDAAGPLQQYLRLAKRMEGRLLRLQNEQASLSNQDLYELVQDARSAALHFSTLKTAARPLIRNLQKEYGKAIAGFQSVKTKSRVCGGVVGAGVVAVVAVFWWNPAIWLAAVGIGAGAGAGQAAGAATHRSFDAERGKAISKQDNVKELDLAIKGLDRSANEARAAISAVFCSQVMQTRLDEALPEHVKRELLATLGVDVDAISSDNIYAQELTADRLQTFREGNTNLRTRLERVLTDAGFESQTTEEDLP